MLLIQNNYKEKSGVSLVELSVVLVIIALLVGAVTGGIKLQRNSQLRSVANDISKFQIMIESFEEKYQDLPGDMSDAHAYWGEGGSSVCGAAASCNGNSDGNVDLGSTSGDSEVYRLWQHLYLAGFVDSSYTGTGGGGGVQADVGINVPSSKIPSGGYTVMYNVSTADATYPSGNKIVVGSVISGSWTNGALLTPTEAYSIDKKTDDSEPDSGKIMGRFGYQGISDGWSTTECLSGSFPNRQYDTSGKDKECILYFDLL